MCGAPLIAGGAVSLGKTMNHHQAIGSERLTFEEWVARLTETGHGELLRELLSQRPPTTKNASRERGQSLGPQDRDRVLTFAEWCALNGFSQATGRRILKRGEGPPVIQLSIRRLGIRQSDNTAWQESRVRAGG